MPEEHKDVEATLQQDTAPDISQQKKWRAIDWIAGGTFIAEVLWGSWWLITQVCRLIPWNPHVSTEHFAQFYCGVGLGVLSVGYLVLILWPPVFSPVVIKIFNILKFLKMKIFKNFKQGKDSKQDNDPRWFHARILSSGIVGGSYAFLLPAVIGLEERGLNSGGAAALRQAILLATGGLIGLIALGETRRKNDNDLKAAKELQIRHKETLDQQKRHFDKQIEEQQEQFTASAFKERKAERRERYTKAVEQLGDEKSPIRMGGVYTLVGLVDEWLEEKSLSDDQRLTEGQVIINNLCAYIRSPFPLYARYDILFKGSPNQIAQYFSGPAGFYDDKSKLESEIDIRLNIIKEIHGRLQGSEENTPGTWSEFEYNFSGSRFFYSVDLTNSYYTKSVNFSGSTYKGEANFSGSTYKGEANFSGSTYENKEKNVLFSTSDSPSIYEGKADFSHSTYQGEANFSGSTYEKNVIFSTSDSRSTYEGEANFSGSTYRGDWVNFSNSTYEKKVIFSTSASRSTYEGPAYFGGSTYKGKASFGESTYEKGVIFSTFASSSTYEGPADFGGSTYKGKAEFGESTYEKDATFSTSGFPSTYRSGAYFSGSTYKDGANFGGSIYKKGVIFSTSIFPSTYRSGAYFSGSTYEGDADFSGSIYQGDWIIFNGSTYQGKADFSGSIFYQKVYFGADGDNSSFSRFTDCAPQFYDETNRKNTLFSSPDNNFTVENGRGYPIYRNLEGLPLGCKFLTSEQKEYLEYKFQEIDETKNKLREVKDDEEKANLIKTLLSFYYDIRNWRWEATTVKVEDVAAEDTES